MIKTSDDRDRYDFEREEYDLRKDEYEQEDYDLDLDEDDSDEAAGANKKRKSDNNGMLVTEIVLCKGAPEHSPSTEKKLAPIFCKPVTTKTKKTFPSEFCNVFHRKRNVNLYIQNGLVVWEFAYDAKVICAIKENIKGRAWNPNLGLKGCWTCPLESLPDAIALYEFMGRTPDERLKKRAQEIEECYGGTSASDAIKLGIRLGLQEEAVTENSTVRFYSRNISLRRPCCVGPQNAFASTAFLRSLDKGMDGGHSCSTRASRTPRAIGIQPIQLPC